MDDGEALSATDEDALKRGLTLATRDRRWEQLQSMLRDVERGEDDWVSVARFACYGMQTKTLGLRPWECPPSSACRITDDNNLGRDYFEGAKALALKERLISAGLSIYEPDPLAALSEDRSGEADGVTFAHFPLRNSLGLFQACR